ncbi:hypothetical protein E2R66_10050 [Mucilaginibacter psychrotolerans]|uniref:Uncharacterized protein n=2 Tax=Mucilaginibacter psychrotolerans TaxID=1524096 RepID=A0A4Y8SGB5_9SPHI|nr:hypothetical protein E2R66_10050 [Mucilaginibacter psychrotolerans]
MIDNARVRQQQKTKQSGQKQKEAEAHEKKNIEALKEQQPYKQKQPKVAFKGAEQEQASGTEQPNREQQRAAFLEKIKQTKEQQTQPSQGKQHEM